MGYVIDVLYKPGKLENNHPNSMIAAFESDNFIKVIIPHVVSRSNENLTLLMDLSVMSH